MDRMEFTAPCHFGLEAVLKKEITDLGYEISQVEDGRVSFYGDAAAVCRAHRDYQMEIARRDFADPPLLTPEEIADVLKRLPALQAWAKKVEEYALDAAVKGEAEFPGFKVVEGRSNRRYADEDAIASALRKAGFKVADIYKPRELLGITAMEKLVGKNRFGELAGKYIIKPEGAPTLVPESDKRPPLNTAAKAAEDFENEPAV